MPLTNYKENAYLDDLFGVTTYAGLSTTTPTKTGTNITEPTDTEYALVAVAASDMGAASGGAITSVNALAWPESSESQGTITHVVFYDDASRTNCIAWGALTASKAIGANEVFRIPAGDLDVAYAQS